MFRGGPVDSRGTGITSGLMDDTGYADGGRVGFQRGGYSTIPGIDDLSQVGIYNPYRSLSSFAGPGPQNITPRQRLGLPSAQTIPSYYTGTARQQIKQREEDLRTQAQAEQEDAASAAFAKAFVPTETGTGTGAGIGTRKSDIDLDEEQLIKQTQLYQKLLGGDEARSQAVYDALLAASPAFFKGKNLREAAPEVLTAINKSGAFDKPKDIRQAAAQLAIQRNILKEKATAEEKARLAIYGAKNQKDIFDILEKQPGGALGIYGGNLEKAVAAGRVADQKVYKDNSGRLIKAEQDKKTGKFSFIELD
jgi:hypothetical protein